MYDPSMVEPMRKELTNLGIQEMRSTTEVDTVLGKKEGTVLVVVNSVCGCAAANARPGVAIALQHEKLPEKITTVFAGQDLKLRLRPASISKATFRPRPRLR